MAKSDNGFLVFHDWKVLFTHTPAEDCKRILLAMFEYSERGEEPPQFEGVAEMTASVVFPAMKRHKEKVEFGRKGGLASAKRAVSEDAMEDAIEHTTEGTTKHTTDNKTRKDKTKQDKDKTKPLSRFAEFWAAYPNKVGKAEAQKVWDKLSPDDALCDTILSAVEAQKRSPQWTKDGGQYIPHPRTWLNQRRWEDELAPIQLTGMGEGTPDYTDPDRYKNLSMEI